MNVSDLDEQEIGEVISRNLRSIPKAQSRVPGNFEARSIFGREKFALIKDAYESPERALDNYIRSTVDAVETRKFLGQVKKPKSETVGFKGSEDSSPSGDLGSRVNLDDNLASVIAKDFLKGKKFDNEDLEKLKEKEQEYIEKKVNKQIKKSVKILDKEPVIYNNSLSIEDVENITSNAILKYDNQRKAQKEEKKKKKAEQEKHARINNTIKRAQTGGLVPTQAGYFDSCFG